jgi:3-deoxy-D-manno-octulosonic-acid transferase
LPAPTVGDLKTAAPPLPVDGAELARLRALIGNSPLFLAASLHPGEEDAIAATHQSLLADHPDLITIMVPRHPIRGPEWAEKFAAKRRSAGSDPSPGAVYVVDSMGELGLWYRLAPFAFIGFSLSPAGGGQNPLEAARLGCGVVVGPGVKNFTEAVGALASGGGVLRVTDPEDLTSAIRRLLSDGHLRESLRLGASHAARAEAAVLDRVMAALAGYLPINSV